MIDKTFERGEVRQFEYIARPCRPNDAVVITQGHWALWRSSGAESAEAQGECTIDGDRIVFVVPFDNIGDYYIKLTVVIPPETIKKTIGVRVVK